MLYMQEMRINSTLHDQMIDITEELQQYLPEDYSGSMIVYVPHTSAAITINEGFDSDVQSDILEYLQRSVPWDLPLFKHREGNTAAHIKAMIVGNNESMIIENGKLLVGTWERVFFCEFDGPRTRKIWIQLSNYA